MSLEYRSNGRSRHHDNGYDKKHYPKSEDSHDNKRYENATCKQLI